MTERVCWINGWQRRPHGWALEAVTLTHKTWGHQWLPASWLLENKRLFEPSAFPFEGLSTASLKVRVELSQLSPLIEPGRLLAPLVPEARCTRHSLYPVAGEEQTLYLPAALLLRELWLWTPAALDAMLTPNSLARWLLRAVLDDEVQVNVSGALADACKSDVGLRRLCWLAQRADAQSSWASVLTFAMEGSLRLRLPQGVFEAWAWGVELPTGLLVCELSSAFVKFELPQEGCRMRVGQANRRCPPPPQRRTGMLSF